MQEEHTLALDLVANLDTALLDVFLGVVPSTTSVGLGDGQLDAGGQTAHQQTAHALNTEESTSDDRGEDDQQTRKNHLPQRSVRGDLDALAVVRLSVS